MSFNDEYERKLDYVFTQVISLCRQTGGSCWWRADTRVHSLVRSEPSLSVIRDYLDELERRKKIIIWLRKEAIEGGWAITLTSRFFL
jgi:hypothetical protein